MGAPEIALADCLTQEPKGPDVMRNPEPGFFILGAKSYGRNSHFLIHLGLEQIREVVGIDVAVLVAVEGRQAVGARRGRRGRRRHAATGVAEGEGRLVVRIHEGAELDPRAIAVEVAVGGRVDHQHLDLARGLPAVLVADADLQQGPGSTASTQYVKRRPTSIVKSGRMSRISGGRFTTLTVVLPAGISTVSSRTDAEKG